MGLISKLPKLIVAQVTTLALMLGLSVGAAQAHVLKQDNGISAVLHIPPEDNPSADQPTSLELSFGDPKDEFSLSDCVCGVTVTDTNSKTIQQVPIRPAAASSRLYGLATVRFPAIGVYHVIVTGDAKNGRFNTFSLDYLVRVAISASGSANRQTNSGDVVTISAGALIILVMMAYTAISRGERYKQR